MEALITLIAFLFCVVLPIALVVALIIWLVRPRDKGASRSPGLAAAVDQQSVLRELDRLLDKWQAAGQLSRETASQLHVLIAQERGLVAQPAAAPEAGVAPPAASPTTPPAVAESRRAAPAPVEAPAPEPSTASMPAPQPPVTPAVPPAPAGPSFGERLGGALLALRTRQTVLFLGAFLLLVSALILIVFNWASFPPILQFALIAGVCGGFWGGGAWLIRQTELDRAGRGLQAVGGLLVPVVAFSLSRPGLLELAPRAGWLLASILCVPIYALAAWRLRRIFYMVAACVSVASGVLAALDGVDNAWLPFALVLTLAAYLPLSQWLRSRAPDMAAGPRWVAHTVTPLALLAGGILIAGDPSDVGPFAALLWAAAGFYALATWLERYPLWAWCAAVAAPAALLTTINATHLLANEWLPLALVAALALYLPLARWLRTQAATLADAPYWTAHAGVILGLLAALSLSADGRVSATALASTLWAGTAFYLLALSIERLPVWAWPAALLAPAALATNLTALSASATWWSVAPALLALVYIAAALALEPRFRAQVRPAYLGAAVLIIMSGLPMLASAEAARWALPLLLAGFVIIALAYHRGRLAWLNEPSRLGTATLSLTFAGASLAAWALALLDLTTLGWAERGMILMPLAGLYLLGAARWPGAVRRAYDLALQALGVALAVGAAALTLDDPNFWMPGMAALTAIWTFQALRHRHWVWSAAALGSGLAAGALWLEHISPPAPAEQWAALGLAYAALYLIGGALLRRTSWNCWSWPAAGWGALAAVYTLLIVTIEISAPHPTLLWHVLAVLALAALAGLSSALWRAAWPGFAAAALLAFATLLAADRGFFAGWPISRADFGYIICGITFGLGALGQALRRVSRRYAYPYEIVGFAVLTAAPWPTAGDSQHATLVWAAMLVLYALATRLYKLRWASAPALLAFDMMLLNGTAWLVPGGRPAGAGLTLLGAAWVQGLLGLWWSRREAPARDKSPWFALQPAYVVAVISGCGALAIGSGADDVLAIVAFGLAALLAALSTAHHSTEGAWGTLGLLALGFAALHRWLGVGELWSMAWGVVEALGVCLAGWTIETFERSNVQAFNVWRRPLSAGPLIAGTTLTAALLSAATFSQNLPPLTFALATLALLLATLAVRRRASAYTYGAGAALVAAGLCQLYDWGFRQPQWFAIPAGLYLLALAEGLRRFQGQRRLSQLVESGAIVLLLGVTFGQSLRADGLESQMYAAWLCVESLLLLGYGVLAKLRAPFLGGVAFFVAGVLWLSIDPIMAANKWVLLGLLGLLLVGFYLLLERRQQELVRAGRALIETVSSWS